MAADAKKNEPAKKEPGKKDAVKKQAVKKQAGPKPDLVTIGGLALALAGILGGLMLEGGRIGDVAQITAAMIVLGGTLGAVMVGTPLPVLRRAAGKLPQVFLDSTHPPNELIEEILNYAVKARKHGVVALEQDAAGIADPFLRKALNLAVDGTDLQELRKMMELEIELDEKRGEAEVKVFEAAGGYSPTIGIIGAVLGLIQVMKNIQNTEEVGKGIAVAFVATVYGVGAANLFYLPAATKLKARLHERLRIRELMLDGVVGIVEGLNPKLIRIKLEAYASTGAEPAKEKAAAKDKSAKDKAAPAKDKPPAAPAAPEAAKQTAPAAG